MTVPVGNGRSQVWTADGSNRHWDFPFKAFSASDIALDIEDTTGFQTTVATGFTVAGLNSEDGGTVTYPVSPAAPLPAGYKITVVRFMPLTQPDRIGNQGGFHAETHERALDRLMMLLQQVYHYGSPRLVKAPFHESDIEMTLPALALRAGKVLEFDATGRPIAGSSFSLIRDQIEALANAKGIDITLQTYVLPIDPDYSNAFDRATEYLRSVGGGILRTGRGKFPISRPIDIPLNCRILLKGEGPGASIIRQTNATADGVRFTYDDFLIAGGGVVDLTIEAGAGFDTARFFGSGSTGMGLTVTRANDNFLISNVSISNFDNGILLRGCWNIRILHPLVKFFRWAGIQWMKAPDGTVGAGTHLIGGKVSNNGYAGPHPASVGLRFLASGGEYIDNVDVTATNTGIRVEPTGGDQALYLWFNNVLADTSTQNGWVFDGTNGLVSSIRGVNCWAGFCGENGMLTVGPNLDGVKMTNMALRQNKHRGWWHQGGNNVELVSPEIAGNSRTNANVYPGVEIADTAWGWSIIGGTIGNYANGGALDQAEGVKIAGASGNFRLSNVRFEAPGPGKSHLSYNESQVVGHYIGGNIPRQTYGLNASVSQTFNGAMLALLPTNSTRYLGPVGENVNTNVQPWVTSKDGIVRRFYVAFGAAPGAGQSFTFTVMKNGVATGMTATATGTGPFSVETTTGAFTVTKGDAVDIRVVSSNGAATAQMRYFVEVEP